MLGERSARHGRAHEAIVVPTLSAVAAGGIIVGTPDHRRVARDGEIDGVRFDRTV